jgi:hypothetical protein
MNDKTKSYFMFFSLRVDRFARGEEDQEKRERSERIFHEIRCIILRPRSGFGEYIPP